MKLKEWAKLLMTGTMVFSSVSGAQMQGNWGVGMYGGMQPCPWGGGAASGASDEDDELAELKQDRVELKQEKRRLEKMISQLERDRERLKEAIDSTVKPAWAEVAIYHMEYGMNCCIVGAQPPVQQQPPMTPVPPPRPPEQRPPPVQQQPPVEQEPPVAQVPPPRPPAPPRPPVQQEPEQRPPVAQDPGPEVIRRERTETERVVIKMPSTAPAPAPVQSADPTNHKFWTQPPAPVETREPKPVIREQPKAPVAQTSPVKAPEVEERPLPEQVAKPPAVKPPSKPPEEPKNPSPSKNPGDPCTIEKGKNKGKKGKYDAEGVCLSALGQPSGGRMPASELGGGRMPAEERVSIKATIGGGTASESAGDNWGDLSNFSGPASSADGGKTLCYESKRPYVANPGETVMSPPFQAICKSDGGISENLCRNRYFQQGEIRGAQATNCSRSLERYRKITKEIDRAKQQVGKMENDIADIGFRIGDLKMASRLDREMEADCPSGTCYESGFKRSSRSRGPSTGQTLLAVGLDALAIGANYFVAKDANKWNARTGNQALPYATNIGGFFPYNTASLYGGMYGGMNGSYGCSPMMGGGGSVFGPMGMAGPYGMGGSIYGGAGGAFGYPQGYGYPQMGGGMYGQGAGPWGMSGPWGTGGWPGGYPGAGGFVGGIAGGIAGGYMGMPGMAGGYMGMPGMAGGIAGGYMGMPGMAGGYMGMPGMAGGMAGGIAGGYMGMPGMAGMAGGFLAPFPGGGMDAYTQQQYLQLQQQQTNLYLEAERRKADQTASWLRNYQGFSQEYMQFMQKWNQFIGSGPGGNGQFIFSPGPSTGSGTLPGGSGPTSGTTPGRTR